MNTTESAETDLMMQSGEEMEQIPPVSTFASTMSQIPMYKTDRGFNINVVALAKDAIADLDRVRVIGVPSPVKTHRVGKLETEAPTLSEVGGGTKNNFCQVIAGKDGRPVGVDDIHYINTDPTRSNINHGTASVGIGNYFAIGWCMKADLVILIYEIIGLEEYVHNSKQLDMDEHTKPVAKLTCQLVGSEISNWRKSFCTVPEFLSPLMDATRHRLRNDVDIPFYLDIFRMTKPVPELAKIALDVASSDDIEHHESDEQFMINVMSEILDIRYHQYRMIPPSQPKRRVDVLRLVETLVADPDGNFIDITLTPIRDDCPMTTYRFRLTRNNFVNDANRMLLERGLTLTHTSYDRLLIDLEGRSDEIVVVHLTSLR